MATAEDTRVHASATEPSPGGMVPDRPADGGLALAGPGSGGPIGVGGHRISPWKFQLQVLKALILREMTARHGESRLGYLLSLIAPILFISLIFAMMGLRGRLSVSTYPQVLFLLTGWPMWIAFRAVFDRAANTGSRNSPLMMFPQITQLDLIFAAIILEAATNLVVFLLVVALAMVVFKPPFPDDPVGVLLCYGGCVWLGAGVGMGFCAVERIFPIINNFMRPLIRVGMWISGTAFMAGSMPGWLLPYLSWNPIFHCVEGARELWYGVYQSPIFDPGYIIAVGFCVTTAGLVLERVSRRFA